MCALLAIVSIAVVVNSIWLEDNVIQLTRVQVSNGKIFWKEGGQIKRVLVLSCKPNVCARVHARYTRLKNQKGNSLFDNLGFFYSFLNPYHCMQSNLSPGDGMSENTLTHQTKTRQLPDIEGGFNNETSQEIRNSTKRVDKNSIKPSVAINPRISVEDMYRRLVFVSALSDNHFEEAKEMLRTVTECLPETTIIIYDLGLSRYIQNSISAYYKNVKLRRFPFYAYPPHVSSLQTYAWKPLIVKQMATEYDIIMYGDSSVRLLSCNITGALQHLLHFPFFGSPIRSKAVQHAHDGMIRYLQYPRRRSDMKDVASLMGGCWLMWANSEMKEKLIAPWAECALNKDCIAPFGSELYGCHNAEPFDDHYVGCHRYDQSALNLILAREFGLDYFSRSTDIDISNSIWLVNRTRIK